MNVTEVATLGAAIASWVAIYWNRRLTHSSEKDIASRIEVLEEINRKLREERLTRESQIGARIEAHDALQREALLTEVGSRGTSNDLQFLADLLLYQQFAMVYLSRRGDLDSKDSSLAQQFSSFAANVVHFLGARNYCNMISARPERTLSAVKDAADREVSTFKDAVSSGQDLIRALGQLGAVTWADGKSFDDGVVPMSEVISNFDDILSRLQSLDSRAKSSAD